MGTLRYTRRDVVDSTLVWRLTAKLPKITKYRKEN